MSRSGNGGHRFRDPGCGGSGTPLGVGPGGGRGAEDLEGVVLAIVVVPVLIVGADKADAKLNLPPHMALNLVAVDGEAKLVAEAIVRSWQVGPLHVEARLPRVQRASDKDSLVEVDVDHTDNAFDGADVAHVSRLQADLLVSQSAEEIRTSTRLVKKS